MILQSEYYDLRRGNLHCGEVEQKTAKRGKRQEMLGKLTVGEEISGAVM